MDLKFVLRMTKGRLSQYLKEIRDKKMENQIFGPRYTLRKSYEVRSSQWHFCNCAMCSMSFM